MLKKIKQIIKKFYFKGGYKNKSEKLVVIESDDWGSIRSTKEGVEFLKTNYSDFKLDAYQEYDCIETLSDIQDLISVLKKHCDKTGRNPVFTANFVMNNIDCKEVINGNVILKPFYEQYNNEKVIDYILENKNLFYPQLHGNVHLNISKLLNELNNDMVKKALTFNTIGVCSCEFNGMDTFSNRNKEWTSVDNAAKMFEKVFGYQSKTTIFPCYTWCNEDENRMFKNGIKCLQGSSTQWIPLKNGKTSRKLRYMGQKNKYGQTYLTRNCHFEPTKYRNRGQDIQDCLEDCFNQVQQAFKYNKPAIICTHRCNYVKSIYEENQKDNLELLDKLLSKILKSFPDCKFITSEELHYKISKGEK